MKPQKRWNPPDVAAPSPDHHRDRRFRNSNLSRLDAAVTRWQDNDFDFDETPEGTDMNAKTETIPEMVSVGAAIGGVVAKADQSRQALQAQIGTGRATRREMTPMAMVGRAHSKWACQPTSSSR
jgi:hypothetical protein